MFDSNTGLSGFVLCVGGICVSLFSIAVIKEHDPVSVGKERICLTYESQSLSTVKRSQSRNTRRKLETETEAEAMKECCLLLAPHSLLSLLSYAT